MSSKKRRNIRARQIQNQGADATKRGALPLKILSANDGFINRLAYLGEASLLSQANDFERNYISRDYETLTVAYRENWIAKRIIDTPCEDMTRSWYTISSNLDQDKLDELAELESKHSVKQEITNALRWARLYGGAAAVIVIKGQEDMLDEPLDYDDLVPGCFRGLIVVDRTSGLDPSVELEEDMDDIEFGYPKYYTVRLNNETNQTMRIHHSRLLMFRGRMLPIMEEVSESYWGASELEHVYEELQKRNATSANIAQLVFQANVGVLKMADFGEIMGMGTEKQKQAIIESIEEENRYRNSFGMMIMGSQDGYEQHPYSFSGLSEIYESFMMDMAGAAEIPATKLYGRSPQGMNATGESDMKNYYEMLAQLQERNLRPAIEKLLPVMCMSLWGKIPDGMHVVFEPLQVTTPSERANIISQVTGTVINAFSAGLISQQTALIELQKSGKDVGAWGSITDEIVESAETEVDQGEGMGDPMGGMMGGMGPGGPEGPEGPDGGPGGGMDPMAAMGGMMPPEEGPEEEKPEATEEKPEVKPEERPEKPEMKPEQKPVSKPEAEPAEKPEEEPKATQKSVPAEAQNEPKEQAEQENDQTPARKPEEAREGKEPNSGVIDWVRKKVKSLIGRDKPDYSGFSDQRVRLIKQYAADHSREQTAKFVQNLFSIDAEAWRTSEEGRHFKLETSTGEIKAGFGGKFNGKKLGEQWGSGSGSKARAKGTKVAAPPKVTPPKAKMPDIPVSFSKYSDGSEKKAATIKTELRDYENARKNAKKVLENPAVDLDEADNALNNLANSVQYSDEWNQARNGEIRATNEFGLKSVPAQWAERLTPREQDILANITEEYSDVPFAQEEKWESDHPEAVIARIQLQAKLLGAEIETNFSDDLLEKYAGVEKRVEVPGQQSMFWGENVPMAPVAREPETQYNAGGENTSESIVNQNNSAYNGSGTGSGRTKAPLNPDNFQQTEPQKFYDTFHAAKKAVQDVQPDKSWRVDGTYSVEDYAKMQCFTTKGGSAVAVHDGDIVSVCKHPGDRGVTGSQLLEFARMKGGNKLDAFGGLYEFYTKNGFEPTSYCEFADIEGIRPPDWDRTRDQKEPVVFFKYTGRSREEIWKAHGKNCDEYVASHKPEEDYSKAKKIRDDSMEV